MATNMPGSMEKIHEDSASIGSSAKGHKDDTLGKTLPVPAQQESTSNNETANQNAVDTSKPLDGMRLVLVFVGLMCSVFCLGLDRSILSTAIPKITNEFDSLGDIAWYGSAYLLTTCCFQLMFGKFYAKFSVKIIYVIALGLFEVGSIVCASAPNSKALIIGRAIAGTGCAGVMSGSLVILSKTLPLQKRPMYMGGLSAATGLAQIIAPTLGGVLTDRATWRWCFWINLPLGAITITVVLLFVRIPETPKKEVKPEEANRLKSFLAALDILGTLCLMPFMICLILALQWGGITYPWSNWRVILCLALFAVLFLAWIYVQYSRGPRATLPFEIVKQRSIASAIFFSFGLGGCQSLMIYYIPIWFQAVKGTDAEKSGVNFLASSAPMIVATVLTGQFASRIGYCVPPMIGSTILMSIATGLIFRYNLDTTTVYWAGTLVMFGFGSGMGIQMPIVSVQAVLKGPAIALGTSVIILSQIISGAIFLAVGENLFHNKLVQELVARAPMVNPEVVVGHGATGLKTFITKVYDEDAAFAVLGAYNEAVRRCFLLSIILASMTLFGSLSMQWISLKAKKPEKGGEEGPKVTEEGAKTAKE